MNKNKPKNICGPRIRRIRLRLGMTQAELAKKVGDLGVGMSRSGISKIESQVGRRVLDGELLALAKCLVTTPHWLVTGREPKPRR
ncbi:MAG TPA: helix-turn-helix transcriptional regulator [Kiritimatiellia bacterium]|nr:helix-turn-helix transcriptional regulator [Kiritimatiellia bacterium]